MARAAPAKLILGMLILLEIDYLMLPIFSKKAEVFDGLALAILIPLLIFALPMLILALLLQDAAAAYDLGAAPSYSDERFN